MKRLLSIEHPALIKEWSDRNDITPEDVTVGSHKKVWWIGSCGHEWEAIVKNRVKGSGCPYCSGNKVLKGFNDLASLYPEIAAEWVDEDITLRPEYVTINSNKVIKWRCRNGHEWNARISDRTEGHGCPICSRQGRIYETVYERIKYLCDISDVWSGKNAIPITEASASPRRMYWWKCRRCGEDFRASVGHMIKGAICSSCRKYDSEIKYTNMLEDRKDNRSRRFQLPPMSFEYYATKCGIEIYKDDDSIIGIPFQFFLPEYRVAVDFSEQRNSSKQHRRNNMVINDLCLKTQIKMIRILESEEEAYRDCLCISRVDNSYEGISESLQALFEILKIDADVNVERDLDYIKIPFATT